jgi:hypothetical protein
MMFRGQWPLAVVGLSLIALGVTTGCGKPANAVPEGATEVSANTAFGSQCPYGSIADPKPTQLVAWDCPNLSGPIQLLEPVQPMIFMADCKKKTIAIRSGDRKLDSAWEVMPDGSFYVTVDGWSTRLKSDGNGHSNCLANMATDVIGKLDCKDRDKANIDVEAVYWLGKGKKPSECKIPSGCYFHAVGTVRQCQ